MSVKYHTNLKGETSICLANIRACPFGKHYDTFQEAREDYEFTMNSLNPITAIKKKANYIFNEAQDGIPGSGARQGHGIIYENNVINRFNLIKSTNPTSLFDARTQSGVAVSIKNNKLGASYGMGNIFTQATINEPFIIIAGEWKNNRLQPEKESYYFIKDPIKWQDLFSKTIMEEYKNLLSEITNDHTDDAKWRRKIRELKKAWIENFGGKSLDVLIMPAPKRDHKNQKRVQCVARSKKMKDCYNIEAKDFERLIN